MNDIDSWLDSWLRECVFYPCSRLHGGPVKFLGKRFQRFFYADYSVDRKELDKAIAEGGFKGYQISSIDDLTPDSVFGMTWKRLEQEHCDTISRVHFEWSDPFVVLCRFERSVDRDDDHGPATFEFMFARSEAIATFKSAFSRRNIAPKCQVHIRCGNGLGGNFDQYPQCLRTALLENGGGLPAYLLYDYEGSNKGCNYLDLIERYNRIDSWGRPNDVFYTYTLAELIKSDDVQGLPAVLAPRQ